MAADFKSAKVVIGANTYTLPSDEVYPITTEELAGVALGQREDLLMFPERAYYNVSTGFVYKVTGAALVLVSADGAASLPAGGTEGQVLSIVSGSPDWDDAPSGLPATGAEGEVLKVVAGVPAWAVDETGTGLPVTGAEGEVLKVVGGVPAWAVDATGGGTAPAAGSLGAVNYPWTSVRMDHVDTVSFAVVADDETVKAVIENGQVVPTGTVPTDFSLTNASVLEILRFEGNCLNNCTVLEVSDCPALSVISMYGWTTAGLTGVLAAAYFRRNASLSILVMQPGSVWTLLSYVVLDDLPSMTSFDLDNCPALTDFELVAMTGLTTLYLTGNALTQLSVDGILNSLDLAGNINGTVDLSGGTSSAPSVAGLVSAANLIGKGWTVTTN